MWCRRHSLADPGAPVVSTPRTVQRLFDEKARQYTAKYERPHSMWDDEKLRRRELLTQWAESLGPLSTLDAGCGTGTALAKLTRYLPDSRLVGLDVSSSMLQQAKALNASSVSFLQ